MIRYSTLQKKAVIALVFEAMIVDNEEINNKRSSYLQVVSELMQISNNLFKDAMENMPHEECVAILNDMSLLEKSRVAIIIYQMFT